MGSFLLTVNPDVDPDVIDLFWQRLKVVLEDIRNQGEVAAQPHLTMLVDRSRSMTPLRITVDHFVQRARHILPTKALMVTYFSNNADQIVYGRPNFTSALAPTDLFPLGSLYTALIVSDAGAARGYLSQERVERTRKFVALMGQPVQWCVWLNPIPRGRWQGSSAEEIARLVPMKPLDPAGLDAAAASLVEWLHQRTAGGL